MKKKYLNGHKRANCHVEIEKGKIRFVSCKTPVFEIEYRDRKHWLKFDSTFTCNATTRKQSSWFLNEYVHNMDYRTLKRELENGVREIQVVPFVFHSKECDMK